jgi:hypothetical protein
VRAFDFMVDNEMIARPLVDVESKCTGKRVVFGGAAAVVR